MCSRKFCDYDKYYGDQVGGALDISYYRGSRHQQGNGIFSSAARRYGIPVLKYLTKEGFYAGKDIISDVSSGKKFSKSVNRSLRKRAGSALKKLGEKIEQSGTGLRKKPKFHKKRKLPKPKSSSKSKPKKKGSKLRYRKTKNNKARKFDIFK